MMSGELFTRMISENDLSQSFHCWTGNDATDRNHHGLVDYGENPFDILLNWKKSATDIPRFVGCFRLFLENLVREGYLPATKAGRVRLRFYHAPDGCIYIQRKALNAPKLLVGQF